MPDHYCEKGSEEATQVINLEEWTLQHAADVLGISPDSLAPAAAQAALDLIKKITFGAAHLKKGEKETCIKNIEGAASFFKESKDQKVQKQKPVSILLDEMGQIDKQILQRLVLIDTRHRKDLGSSTTDFIVELESTLTNVVSIKLNTISIPSTWDTFSQKQGNSSLQIETIDFSGNVDPSCGVCDSSSSDILPSSFSCCDHIADGTYTRVTFLEQLNKKFGNCIDITSEDGSKYVTITNKTEKALRIIFFKPGGFSCGKSITCVNTTYKNNNLGWYMGFRTTVKKNEDNELYIELDASGGAAALAVADTPLDIYGPQYLVLAIDDYNKHHMNKTIVMAASLQEKVSMPNYYAAAAHTANQCVEDPNRPMYPSIQKNPNFPRTLTNSQLTTINSILETHKEKNHNAPNLAITNSFAIIPVPHPPEPLLIWGGSLLHPNGRNYFRPVSITRLHIKLYDDRGRILNLNNSDWHCSIIVSHLYKY